MRLLAGFPPGGGSDTVARIIAPKLGDAFGYQWVVDNRPGAAGNIATEMAAKAAPDGYTTLLGFSTTLTVNPVLYRLPFDVIANLQPIINVAAGQYILTLHPSVPVRTLQEFVELAKSKPGALNYSSGGVGSAPHLAAELFVYAAHINLTHVPYKGGAPAALAVLGGEVHAMFNSLPLTVPHLKTGKLRGIAATGPRRAAVAPEIPTVAEAGFPGFEMTSWYGLLAPAKTPATIIRLVYQEASKVLQAADVREQFLRQGLEVDPKDPAEFAAQISRETRVWAKVISAAGIRAE